MEPWLVRGFRRHPSPDPTGAESSRVHIRFLLLVLLLLLMPRRTAACSQSYELDPTIRDPEALTQRWPWRIGVQANSAHICAGTLVVSQGVLTEAHCLTEEGNNYTVRAGNPWSNQTTKTSSDVPVLQVTRNSRYQALRYWSWFSRVNDVGFLKLQSGLKFSKYVWPVCLPGLDYVLEDNAQCTVNGWGYSKANGVWPQFLALQEKEVTTLNSRECERFYHKVSNIPFRVHIIKDQGREHFCYEITGEPLVCTSNDRWYLMGVMSWGAGCNKKAPPIFLQVSSFQPRIWNSLSGQPVGLLVPFGTLLLAVTLPSAS